eukprot:Clim_evm23s210 gene=Clim_evmTU23s210
MTEVEVVSSQEEATEVQESPRRGQIFLNRYRDFLAYKASVNPVQHLKQAGKPLLRLTRGLERPRSGSKDAVDYETNGEAEEDCPDLSGSSSDASTLSDSDGDGESENVANGRISVTSQVQPAPFQGETDKIFFNDVRKRFQEAFEKDEEGFATGRLQYPSRYYFRGAGWLMIYHWDVCCALQDFGMVRNDTHLYGASAGSLAAAGLIVQADWTSVAAFAMESHDEVFRRGYRGLVKTKDLLKQSIAVFLMEEKVYEEKRSDFATRLHVAVNRLHIHKLEHKILTGFQSQDEMLTAVASSCRIPVIMGKPKVHNGEYLIDGAIGTPVIPQEALDEGIVQIGVKQVDELNIKPPATVPARWGYVPPKNRQVYKEIFEHGYKSTVSWLESKEFVKPRM